MGTGTLGVDFSVSELGMYITGYNNYDTWECIERNSLRVMRSCTHFEVSIFRQRLWTFFDKRFHRFGFFCGQSATFDLTNLFLLGRGKKLIITLDNLNSF